MHWSYPLTTPPPQKSRWRFLKIIVPAFIALGLLFCAFTIWVTYYIDIPVPTSHVTATHSASGVITETIPEPNVFSFNLSAHGDAHMNSGNALRIITIFSNLNML